MKDASRARQGFTLIEIVVTCIMIAIAIGYATLSYLRSLEMRRAEAAAGVMKMVGMANRMYAGAHSGNYLTGVLTNAGCAAYGAACRGTGNDVCDLFTCGYLVQDNWDYMPYQVAAAANAASCLGMNGTQLVACVRRCTDGASYICTPPRPSNLTIKTQVPASPYRNWGYTLWGVTVPETITPISGAPPAP